MTAKAKRADARQRARSESTEDHPERIQELVNQKGYERMVSYWRQQSEQLAPLKRFGFRG